MTPLEDSLFTLGVISLNTLQGRDSCTEQDEDSARIRGYLQTLEVLANGSWPGLSPEALPMFRWLIEKARPLVSEID